ncbi:L-threonylcarbamoyladenylate synthase [Paenibacillus radicis (ex Gao et al. 2016)]|uniref:Threonylcarbamoyl-AMP synthase n=1 Tax=Paenibacillus radicis (ex Gao et al. 2016) TaxID=1737354 RepID=A0A917M925_9BACL|nr:L-threonylcarbamoyladenylate synthase [Paenibacillus radicis (ex Gao et al. 2016)]GGG85161.1 threonylcarbamoyl-AMP synthase [Paenibacillus radicis (ex Gao et al. 2016)]
MKMTKVWQLEGELLAGQLTEAAELLKAGELVAFPTETVYGLGADARSTQAVEQIFAAKGRPSDNPLIVHIASIGQLDELVLPYPELASRLMQQLWPGPLTIVLPVKPGAVSPLVTAGLATVGVRMPDHAAALELIGQANCPVAAPSANRSGRPSPTTAAHVLEDLDGAIAGIVDGGATGVGLESTVVELAGDNVIRILRPGGVTPEQLLLAAPDAMIDTPPAKAEATEAPRSPGMKYTHYAPQGDMEIVQGDAVEMTAYIRQAIAQAKSEGLKTGALVFAEREGDFDADVVLTYGGGKRQLEQAAQRLYAALRQFDAEGVQRIWAEGCEEQGIGLALMNRLAKAAGNQVTRL